MDISSSAQPSYNTANDAFLRALADLPVDEARIKACEVIEYLKRSYLSIANQVLHHLCLNAV